MKYRLLSPEELEELKPEFINFLASNSITAADWVKLKESAPEKVETLIGIFSDIVFEKILKKIYYVEHREKNSLLLFNFTDEKIILAGLNTQSTEIDLNDQLCLSRLSTDAEFIKAINPEIFITEKKYNKKREEEIFDLLNKGALITDEKLFNVLITIYQKEK